jgi:negative regulator of genetic competence, sporulation and motility
VTPQGTATVTDRLACTGPYSIVLQPKKDGIVVVIHKATQGLKYVDPKYSQRRKTAEYE